MYKKIMIPIALDQTEHVDEAIAISKALSAEGAELILMTVLEEVPSYIRIQIPRDMLESAKTDAVNALKALADRAGTRADCSAVYGIPGSSLVDFAEARGVDLMIIASHRPGLKDYFLGSTAARAVRHAGCAVHVIR